MFRDLFINASILTSFVSIISQVFRNSGLSKTSPVKHRIISGIIWGLLGVLLMEFGLRPLPTVIVDFRNIAIILSAYYGGFISVAVTGLIIGLVRILGYGVTEASRAAVIMMVFIIIGTGIIAQVKMVYWKKWTYMNALCLILSSILFFTVITDRRILVDVLLSFWVSTFILGLFIFFYTQLLFSYGKQYRKWKVEAVKDFLTGLYNVRQFKRVFTEQASAAVEHKKAFSLLMIDIDFFKKVNDTYGHAEGDNVLKVVSALLLKVCRGSDQVFRVGGEELAVLLSNCGSKKAMEVAERIRKTIASYQFFSSENKPYKITVSIGVATYPDSVPDPDKMIALADNALYEAKRTGRNRAVQVSPIKARLTNKKSEV
ncbi:MAG TPA: diguanylate cyclase [Bacillota bacterium]|nr:diguanylate cyclase [Bacillota bacterium]